MIRYQLRCSEDHEFEAWFKDSASFDRQAKRGVVECPVCGGTDIVKAPMAPRIASSRAAEESRRAETVARKILEDMGKLRKHVEENCDYVGDKFAEEARRMHYGESEERGIYGEATPSEVESLKDEEIPVHKIPWGPRKPS
jgi:hypothetical protein